MLVQLFSVSFSFASSSSSSSRLSPFSSPFSRLVFSSSGSYQHYCYYFEKSPFKSLEISATLSLFIHLLIAIFKQLAAALSRLNIEPQGARLTDLTRS